MAAKHHAIVKTSRRLGLNLAETAKVQRYLEQRSYPPGQPGRRAQRRPSDYALRLREKQKLRFLYDLRERAFRNLVLEASQHQGTTGEVLLQLLEARLDNTVFRLGLAYTRHQARQFVRHGHILVNGRKTTIPAQRLKPEDEIVIATLSRGMPAIRSNLEEAKHRPDQAWLELDADAHRGRFLRLPRHEELSLPIELRFVIEYYAR